MSESAMSDHNWVRDGLCVKGVAHPPGYILIEPECKECGGECDITHIVPKDGMCEDDPKYKYAHIVYRFRCKKCDKRYYAGFGVRQTRIIETPKFSGLGMMPDE